MRKLTFVWAFCIRKIVHSLPTLIVPYVSDRSTGAVFSREHSIYLASTTGTRFRNVFDCLMASNHDLIAISSWQYHTPRKRQLRFFGFVSRRTCPPFHERIASQGPHPHQDSSHNQGRRHRPVTSRIGRVPGIISLDPNMPVRNDEHSRLAASQSLAWLAGFGNDVSGQSHDSFAHGPYSIFVLDDQDISHTNPRHQTCPQSFPGSIRWQFVGWNHGVMPCHSFGTSLRRWLYPQLLFFFMLCLQSPSQSSTFGSIASSLQSIPTRREPIHQNNLSSWFYSGKHTGPLANGQLDSIFGNDIDKAKGAGQPPDMRPKKQPTLLYY
jgi:hypothetical protein